MVEASPHQPERRILNLGESYTFSRYFELPFNPEDILADLDCRLIRQRLELPHYLGTIERLEFLQTYLARNLEFVTPISEVSRREVLIAPTLLEVCAQTQARLNIEYAIKVNDWLKGTLDYYIQAPQGLLIIEAKQADLSRGFLQLAIELIALDQWITSPAPILYGAVTTGDIWKFGKFDRIRREITEDRALYRIPDELEQLMRILVAVVKGTTN